jgi:hypothetical protein
LYPYAELHQITADGTLDVARRGRTIVALSLPGGSTLAEMPVSLAGDWIFAPSVGGEYVAAANNAGEIRVWELPSGNKVADAEAGSLLLDRLAVSRDGRSVVLSGSSATLRLCRLPDGDVVDLVSDSYRLGTSVAITPDDRLLMASWDGGTRLWRLPDGQSAGFLADVSATVFSADTRVSVSPAGVGPKGAPRIRICQPRLSADLRTPLPHLAGAFAESVWMTDPDCTADENRWGVFVEWLLRSRHRHDVEFVSGAMSAAAATDIEIDG